MLSFAAHSGVNVVAFDGRVSASAKLTPGSHSVAISAGNAGGQSGAVTLRFAILR